MSIRIDETSAAHRLSKISLAVRDGGGTAPVELTMANKFRDRGHRVTVYGPAEVREHAHAAGFELEQLDWPSHLDPGTVEALIPRMIGSSTAWAGELAPRFADDADVVVTDCVAFGATMAARISGVPCVAVMPTVYVADTYRADAAGLAGDRARALAGINRARGELGLPPVGSLTEQVLDADRLFVLTSRSFELPAVAPPDHVRYVGPQLPRPTRVPRFRLPNGDEPLVLVSLSTTDQGQLDLLERLLVAIAPLPVRALVTLGRAIDPGLLDPPANVVLERFVPHSAVLPHVDAVVTHAGHGTVMAAVSAGVPLVCVPMGRDQPAVAARVTQHGLGVSVCSEAGVGDLRSAICHVLDEPAYREASRRMAEVIEPANRVVEELETLAAVTTQQSRATR